ncbi:MAG TPA: hypothetical protein VNR18_13175 [Hyphomicrobiales bacterium]|nr:hypothetical protein [Hyphomicrobiales bacterium]
MIRTKTSLMTLSVLAAAVMTASAQAAAPSLLTRIFGDGNSTATFTGGATINGGVNYLASVPYDQNAGILAVYAPGTTEVGKEADQYMVVNIGNDWYMRTTTGYEVWDTRVPNLKPYNTKVLGSSENVVIGDLEAALGQSFDGKAVRVNVGYMTDTSPLVYSQAIQFTGAAKPSDSCPTGSGSLPPIVSGGKRLCVLEGNHTADVHLTSNFEYIISGAVFIGGDNRDSATLTLDAGVKTYGESGLDFVVINRGSKISVNGTPSNPVVMTSANDDEATATTRGQWGGLIINGNAPVNGCTAGTAVCELQGEGSTGLYGGNDAHDNSGNLNFLQVKYAGFNITPDNELNGIAFQGTGDGTLVDYVQVHNNSDDGVEFFGGTVNAKHLFLTGNEDDAFDWTFGWKGKVQYVVVITGDDVADQGIEADNNATNRDALPRSNPQLANFTFIGNANADTGILLREGTGGKLTNFVVQGFGDDCINIDHSATFINAGGSVNSLNGNLAMTHSRLNCSLNFREEAGDLFTVQGWFEAQAGNTTGNTGMASYINSATINALQAATQTDSFFDQVDFIGAVKNAENDWTAGWTYKP